MYRYLTQFFLISISLAGLVSCATKTIEGFDRAELKRDSYMATYFSDMSTDYVYKAHISIYGREFGGIVIAKKINDTIHRVAFTTEFGNKLFDFEISDSGFKVNYILEELDRKIILKTLKDDFTLLLKEQHTIIEQYNKGQVEVYKSKDERRNNYLFTDKVSGNLKKLVHATKSKEKVVITYTPVNKMLANNILIEHKDIKLKITLSYINE